MIKKKKVAAETITKFLFKDEARGAAKNLAPAAAAIIAELNRED